MPHPSKAKGNRFERLLVNLIETFEIKAKRAWGSNGMSLGLPEEVDVLMDDEVRIQCKCRKKMPKLLGITENVDIVAIKEDRGETYFIIRAEDYLSDLKRFRDKNTPQDDV